MDIKINMFQITSYHSESFPSIVLHNSKKNPSSTNYKSLIIGENGTGKTRLLNELIAVVRSGNDENDSSKRIKTDFSITFKNSDENIKFSNESYSSDLDVDIDNKVIAISTSFNDKLPFSDDDRFYDEKYQYCGIRETSNASWTSSLMRKTVDNLLSCIKLGKAKKLEQVFKFLSLDNKFKLELSLKKTRKLDIFSCSEQELTEFIVSYALNERRMQVDAIRNFSVENAHEIIKSIKKFVNPKGLSEAYIDVNLSKSSKKIFDAYQNIDLLRRVGLIATVSLSLAKDDKSYDFPFVSASSGESQLLYSMSSFIRYVENNSLVAIDEPEISLHPNWQVKYFSLLDLLLDDVTGCHVIIATHSHFLVSELNPNDSTLVVLQNNGGVIESETITSSTLGWSAESILYRVFNVRTFNSVYLESDLQKAHSMLYSEDCDFEVLVSLNNKFQSLVLDDADPLNKFIRTVQGYIDEHH